MISTELRRERPPEKDGSLMSLEERSDLMLRFADVLDANGESTDGTVSAIEQLGEHLGVRESLLVRWDDVMLETEDGGVKRVSHHAVSPTGIAMNRVARHCR